MPIALVPKMDMGMKLRTKMKRTMYRPAASAHLLESQDEDEDGNEDKDKAQGQP